MGELPPWFFVLLWVGIGAAVIVLLVIFWWTGTLGAFFGGLATPPVERL
jgi:hypothetical protein